MHMYRKTCIYVNMYICQYVYMSKCIYVNMYIYICAYMHYVYFHYHHYPCHHYHYHHHHHHHPHHQLIIIIIITVILHIVHSIHIYSMGLDHGFLVFGSTWWFETEVNDPEVKTSASWVITIGDPSTCYNSRSWPRHPEKIPHMSGWLGIYIYI